MADSRELAFQNQVLSAVMLSRYNLKKKRTQDLKLREEEGKYLTGITVSVHPFGERATALTGYGNTPACLSS